MTTTDQDQGPLIYIIAGEPSGDQLGAQIMRGLKIETAGRVRFAGIGGEQMAEEGLNSLVPLTELAVMGFLEVIPSALRILRRLRQTLADIALKRPDAVVTIDSWGFTGRIHAGLKKAGNPAVRLHYVAPMVWAWNAGRVHHVAARVDHLMCLWPFEPPLFEAAGLASSHVGHPVIETPAGAGNGPAFRQAHDIAAEAPLLVVLPGSRRGEVRRLLPVFAAAVEKLADRHPDLRVVIPTLTYLRSYLLDETASWPVEVSVVTGQSGKFDAFAAANAAIAASGTVSLELAMAGTPHLIAYRVNGLTAEIAKRLVTVRFADMVNILLDRPAIPELLQTECTPAKLAETAERLMTDETTRRDQRAAMAEAVSQLGGRDDPPSRRAARLILSKIADRKSVV